MSQDQRKHEACERDSGDEYLRFDIGLPAGIQPGDHVRFSTIDQLIGQSFELVREWPELRELALFGLSRAAVTNEVDDV